MHKYIDFVTEDCTLATDDWGSAISKKSEIWEIIRMSGISITSPARSSIGEDCMPKLVELFIERGIAL